MKPGDLVKQLPNSCDPYYPFNNFFANVIYIRSNDYLIFLGKEELSTPAIMSIYKFFFKGIIVCKLTELNDMQVQELFLPVEE